MKKILEFAKSHKFVIGLFLFSFILRLAIVIIIETPVISDFQSMYDAAQEILNHTSNYKNTTYFTMWGYQMGHVLYQALMLSICNSVLFLKIMNCLITSFTVVFVYLISKKVASERAAQISSIIYSIFIFPLLFNTVLTNQHLPLLLILIAVYILINLNYDDKFILKSLAIGLILGVSNMLRNEVIVIITAIALYSIVLIIKKENIKRVICSFFIILISYLAIFESASMLLIKLDISTNGLKNMNPAWKFVIGFSYETNGGYNDGDGACAADPELAKQVAKERMQQFDKMPYLFYKKIETIWTHTDLNWSIGHFSNATIYNLLNKTNIWFIFFFNATALFSVVVLIKNKFPKGQTLMTIILLVYFGVYILIEVQARYAYSFQVFEAALCSISLKFIYDKWGRKIIEKISRKYEKSLKNVVKLLK